MVDAETTFWVLLNDIEDPFKKLLANSIPRLEKALANYKLRINTQNRRHNRPQVTTICRCPMSYPYFAEGSSQPTVLCRNHKQAFSDIYALLHHATVLGERDSESGKAHRVLELYIDSITDASSSEEEHEEAEEEDEAVEELALVVEDLYV
jgi:hypothetical protein